MSNRLFLAALVLASATSRVSAQTREQGPWWPHPIWGKDDRAGVSNWITPEKIRASLSLVTTGKVYELGQVYEAGMQGRSCGAAVLARRGRALFP